MSFKKLALVGGVAASLMAGTAYASVIDRPFFQVLGVVVVWGADDTATSAPVVSDFVLLTPASGSAGADLIADNVSTVVTGSLTPVDGSTASGDLDATSFGGAFDDTTGTTSGVLDAGDTLSAFGITNATDFDSDVANGGTHRSSFYVASNAAFDIYAVASNLQKTGDFSADTNMGLDDIELAMSLAPTGVATTDGAITFGAQSQVPGTVEAALVAGETLDQMTTGSAGVNGLKVFDGTDRTAANRGTLVEQSVRFDNVYTLGGAAGYDLSMGSGTISADVTYTVFVP